MEVNERSRDLFSAAGRQGGAFSGKPPLGQGRGTPGGHFCSESPVLQVLGAAGAGSFPGTCALRLRLLREADYELPFLEEVTINLLIGTTRDTALVDTGAMEHTCSLVVFGADLRVLSSAEVEDLLLSMTAA
ncbi:hypothetical protein NDU88_008301 [Pleurodeles waltl]|uniref:Uncharacterized protein n=1 Tax=Pleurodeles waltl TaxID=8319 RepID=A0AAV7U412_PLEWA|nr:hypothetical protein NDU88_008301 [Pleurodeles waltl]